MPTPFRPAVDLLADYATYHRDRRNIMTHLVGVPLIVFAIGVLLSRPAFAAGPLELTPAWAVFALAAAWYLTRGHLLAGLATSVTMAMLLAAAQVLGHGQEHWLAWGAGLFVVGWIIQFIGHYYEGRKPAFVDDVTGLLVGPMFVVVEVLAAAGLCPGLAREIERRAGPTTLRDLAHPVT